MDRAGLGKVEIVECVRFFAVTTARNLPLLVIVRPLCLTDCGVITGPRQRQASN